MNENINLCEILKDCPKGTKLYSPVIGEVIFEDINYNSSYPIGVSNAFENLELTKDGKYLNEPDGECILFPSKDQRDWSKFSAPWYKKEKFDPKTLQPFDRVLVKGCVSNTWKCGLFSHVKDDASLYKYSCAGDAYAVCIPYNEEAKHLVGTTKEAPEFYRYWED